MAFSWLLRFINFRPGNSAWHFYVFQAAPILSLTVYLLALQGCMPAGRPPQVMGKVKGAMLVGGEPLGEGRVNFISSEGFGATGQLQPDGTFELEGPIPVGEYSVFVSFEIAPADRGTSAEDILKTVPEKYQSQATTDLTADVVEGVANFEFDLDAPESR